MTRIKGAVICPSCKGLKCKLCRMTGIVQEEKKRKYNNEPTEVNGIKFDSKKESEYYTLLLAKERAGEIVGIIPQPSFNIIAAFTDEDGKRYQATQYIADFRVTYRDGTEEVIDVKGLETEVFKIKRKLYEQRRRAFPNSYPPLKVIKFDRVYGWIDADELQAIKKGEKRGPVFDWAGWIKAEREKRKWTLKRLGDEVGVTSHTISNWESGRNVPKSSRAKLLRELFGGGPSVKRFMG